MKKDKMSKKEKKEKQKAMVRLCFKITHLFSIHQFKGTGQERHSIPAPSFRFPVCYLTRQSFFFISHNVCRLFPSCLLDSKPLHSSSRLQMTSYSLKNKHRGTEKKNCSPQPSGSTSPPSPLRKNSCKTQRVRYDGTAGDRVGGEGQ